MDHEVPGSMANQDQGHHRPHVHRPHGPIEKEVVTPKDLTRGQFIYAYVPGRFIVDYMPTRVGPPFRYSLITSLFFAWGFAYGLLDSLNKYVPRLL